MAETFAGLKGGALIIGSLLWQDDLNEPGDQVRKIWRDNHLLESQGLQVIAPIRYGRQSSNGEITMVFSRYARAKPGMAWVVPFSSDETENNAHLLREIQAMSVAEGMNGRYISTRRQGNEREAWATIGLILNNTRIQSAKRQKLLAWWQEELKTDPNFEYLKPQSYCVGKEQSCLTRDGMLAIPWVKALHKKDEKSLNQFDYLIATATRPNLPKYPSNTQLLENVKNDLERNYFRNNYKRKITTWQDEKIIQKLGK